MPKPSSKFNDKLRDIHKALLAAHRESAGYSSSITGDEREAINRHLLSTILPTNHRCGSGTIIDAYGHDSGQVDGIIELPYSLSFPLATAGLGAGNRLYLAETVGIAFEYKSDLSAQAKDAIAKVKKIKTLERYALDPYEITTPSYGGFNRSMQHTNHCSGRRSVADEVSDANLLHGLPEGIDVGALEARLDPSSDWPSV